MNVVAGGVGGSAVADDGAVVRGGHLILWRKAEHADRVLHLGEGLQFDQTLITVDINDVRNSYDTFF